MDVFILKLICIAFIFLIVFFYIINAALVQKINDENTLPQIPTYDITLFLVLKWFFPPDTFSVFFTNKNTTSNTWITIEIYTFV